MTQYVINIGALPNDGTGDPLRTAFNDVNLNFDQVFAAGPVLSNVRIANNTILTTNTNGNLILAPNGIGVVQANVSIVPNLANIRNLGSPTQRWATAYLQYVDVSGGLSIAGNLTVGGDLTVQGDIIELGNITTDSKTIHLANSASTANAANGSGILVGANSNIATFLYQSNTNSWISSINISYANGQAIGGGVIQSSSAPTNPTDQTLWWDEVSGRLYVWYTDDDGSQWVDAAPSGVNFANVASNIIPAANVTYSLGNSTNWWRDAWFSSNTVYIGGVGLGTTGNVLTVAGQPVLTNNSNTSVSTTGNITAGYFIGDGSQLTGLPAQYGNANVAAYLPTYTGNLSGGNLSVTGSINTDGVIIAQGNIRGANLNVNGLITATGTITTPGNISGSYLFGNASQLTGIPSQVGLLSITGQTISGTTINGNINIVPEGSGVVAVPAVAMSNTLLYTDEGGYNITTSTGNISINADSGNVYTNSSFLPTNPDTSELGTGTNYWNSIYAGTGGLNIKDSVEDITVNLLAQSGNLVIANAGGLTVADFTFYNNAITIGNLQQDITIGTVGATGNVVFNRSIAVRDSANTRNVFSAFNNGFVSINANNIPTGTAGALNIVGSSSGNYQPVNGAGGMIHITGNDNTLARITVDGYATSNTGPQPAQAGYGLIALRASRGTADNPHYVLQNDILASFSGLGMTGTVANGIPSYSTGQVAGLQFFAAEDFVTNTSGKGTYAQFKLTPVGGSAGVNALQLDTDGITLPVAGSGITFPDTTFQNTAFVPTQVVQSLTVGTGLTQTVTQGNVAINATGVQNVVGTTNQVIVSDSGGKNLTLSLPQNINTNSSVQFGNITVGNIVITGTSTSANTISINDKNFTLANNSTSNTQIDGGGMILGNVSNGSYYRTFLYNLNNNRWDTDGAGLKTLALTADDIAVANLVANGTAHFGAAYEGINYGNAIVQIDANQNNPAQLVQINHSSGTNAMSMFVALNDLGVDSPSYSAAIGITSSTFSNPDLSILGDSDTFVSASGGNLLLITNNAGQVIQFVTGGSNTSNLRATITDTGLSVVGLVQAANLSASGNVFGTNLSITGNITAPFSSSVLTTAAQPNITSVGILTSASVSGNVNAGNLRTSGQMSASGNVTGANFATAGTISATGNITGANLIAAAGTFSSAISATGNITGANLVATAGTFSSSISATGNITGGNINTGGVLSSTGNISGGNLRTTGLVSATGNVDGGNIRTGGIVVASGNIAGGNVLTTGQVSATGAISSGDGISATGNITGSFFIGNGSVLTGVVATTATTAVTVTGNAQPNITSVGTLTSVSVSGNTSSGNLLTTGIVSATGNVRGANINTDGIVSALGNIVGSNLIVTNVTGTLTTAAQPNITSVGTLSSLSVSGNVTAGNLSGTNITGTLTTAAQTNITSVGSLTSLSVVGNIAGGNLSGTNITGTLTTASQTNITAIGTLSALSVSGNITAGNVNSNTFGIHTGNVTGNLTGTVLTASQPNITSVGTLSSLSVTGNVTGGNVLTGGIVSATGNVTSGNISTAGQVTATGNITTSGNFVGNGSALTGVFASSSILKSTLVINPASVGKTAASTQTFTLTGLTTNHKVVISVGTALTYGIFITAAWASAADTLSIQFMNITGGAIDLGNIDIEYIAWV